LVDCDWLAERLADPAIAVVDATYFLPNQGRDAEAEFHAGHIPGARFFDIDVIADRANPLPHMLPTAETFAAAVGRLGIGNDTHVIAYDGNDFLASARVWWTFRVFGHDRVSVLDGGLKCWKMLGLPLSEGCKTVVARSFMAHFRPELVADLETIKRLVATQAQILDARSPERFAGSEPEPRPGLRAGHIPGSRNLFFKTIIDERTLRFKPVAELERLYRNTGLNLDEPVVTTCGTGVTAAILALGLSLLGRPDTSVYDGSWTEWGSRPDTPVERG
jgi:thiosulfate/3-mercaptopyruvate sulfurtransferase